MELLNKGTIFPLLQSLEGKLDKTGASCKSMEFFILITRDVRNRIGTFNYEDACGDSPHSLFVKKIIILENQDDLIRQSLFP